MQSARSLILCGALLCAPVVICPQQASPGPKSLEPQETASTSFPDPSLPDAPSPQPALALDPPQSQTATPGTSQSSSSSQQQTEAPSTNAQQTDRTKAQQQIQEEEHQRILGMVPMFNTTYRNNAVSLTAKEKMGLAFRSAIDPATFAVSALVAGLHEGLDDDSGFGWGAAGYGKRAGAAYLDAFNGTMIGNGILPVIFHQDPRYFRLGHGSATHRILYAAATTVICKHDNTGRWEPNYSNVAGNIISGAISNLYYPSSNSGVGQTISNGMIVTAEGTAGSIFEEFWPEISRKFLHRDPTHGLDAQMRAADAQANQNEKQPPPPQK